MKKIYMTPTLEVVAIQSTVILAGSNYDVNNDFGGGSGGTTGKTIEVNSRQGRGYWDDEDEY